MGITIYTGLPGSGKTARVVSHLMRGHWASGYFIVHNIEGLKNLAVSPEGFCRGVEEVRAQLGLGEGDEFWCKEVQGRLTRQVEEKYKRKVLVVVDEAHDFFGRRTLTDERFAWLSWHRHFGQSIWLLTQAVDMLNKDVAGLGESEIRARRGVVTRQFVYQHFANGVPFRWDRAKVDPVVFGAYTSAELHAPAGARSRLFVFGLVGMLVFGGGFVAYAQRLRHGPARSGQAARGERPQPAAARPDASVPGGNAVQTGLQAGPTPGQKEVAGGVARGSGAIAGADSVVVRAPVSVAKGVSGRGGGRVAGLRTESVVVAPGGETARRLPWDGWAFAGFINGVAYLAKGSELVRASAVLGSEWSVIGGDGGRRVLVVVHRSRGPAEIGATEGQWFGVDG